ncbi:MAG: adenosylcobinamide-GDP ribazoletransferase, partial [Deferribacterota bacterium]|nr:adenosylcobinamide-GDP ribazoletransferase [Deferribacterota bacterium]
MTVKTGFLKKEANSLFSALVFLTVIKIPINDFSPNNSVRAFPLIGLFLGFILYGLTFIDIEIIPLIQVIIYIFLTGAIHIDGLADTSDAIFSHKTTKEKLNIMKDSRIGTMGAISLVLNLLVKFSCFTILENSIYLLFIPAYSRFSMVIAIYRLPYIRENSINKNFFNNKNNTMLIYGLLILIFSILFNFKFIYLIII